MTTRLKPPCRRRRPMRNADSVVVSWSLSVAPGGSAPSDVSSGGRGRALRQVPQAQRLVQHRTQIGPFVLRVVRVVVTDPVPEIRARFIEALAEDPRAGLDIGAETVAQRGEGFGDGRVPARRNLGQPDLIDLHRADIDRAVRIVADPAERSALDVEEDHQQRRRDPVNTRRGQQAVADRRAVTLCRRLRGAQQSGERNCERSHGRAPALGWLDGVATRAIRSFAADHTTDRSLSTIASGRAIWLVASIIASITAVKLLAPTPRSR